MYAWAVDGKEQREENNNTGTKEAQRAKGKANSGGVLLRWSAPPGGVLHPYFGLPPG